MPWLQGCHCRNRDPNSSGVSVQSAHEIPWRPAAARQRPQRNPGWLRSERDASTKPRTTENVTPQLNMELNMGPKSKLGFLRNYGLGWQFSWQGSFAELQELSSLAWSKIGKSQQWDGEKRERERERINKTTMQEKVPRHELFRSLQCSQNSSGPTAMFVEVICAWCHTIHGKVWSCLAGWCSYSKRQRTHTVMLLVPM